MASRKDRDGAPTRLEAAPSFPAKTEASAAPALDAQSLDAQSLDAQSLDVQTINDAPPEDDGAVWQQTSPDEAVAAPVASLPSEVPTQVRPVADLSIVDPPPAGPAPADATVAELSPFELLDISLGSLDEGESPFASFDDDEEGTATDVFSDHAPVPIASGGAPLKTERFVSPDSDLPARLRHRARPADFSLGGYHAHHEVGAGGMAIVYLARAPGLDHDVVLKRIRKQLLSDDNQVKQFLREARIAASLAHENIVAVLDHASEGGEHFLVMEHLDGYDLRELAHRIWASGRPLPFEVVVRMIIAAARALDYAHHRETSDGRDEGLVHRDVSPENLFLTEDGTLKVLDFGIAVGVDSERLTQTGEVKGKVPYLSPEAVVGRRLDGRADIFSLCVTAYFLLTGKRPFARRSALSTLKAIVEDEAPPLRRFNPHLPEALDLAVRRGLTKDRGLRWARANALADALATTIDVIPDDSARALVQAADAAGTPKPDSDIPSPPAISWARWSASGDFA